MVATLNDCVAFQIDLDRLEKWVNRNLMISNKKEM